MAPVPRSGHDVGVTGNDGFDEHDAGAEPYGASARRERRAPICRWCGVTALPGSAVGVPVDFACDNADCDAFGERAG